MSQLKDVCLALARSESEQELVSILKREGYWDREADWRFFGDDESNYSTIGNQQSKPEAAIVEKIINSVDAMLMAECMKAQHDPTSKEAPQSISQALEQFYKIPEGKLTNLSAKERSHLADNIIFVASGQRTNPNYTIIDKGEGQSSARLPDTILSIKKSNKLKIPFVQGKFNMGGTGVFRFCGERNIQLVITKRNPEIAKYEGDPTKSYWCFTVIRREDPVNGARSSNYKYLAPSGVIPFFEAAELPLLPSEYPNPLGRQLQSGTFIKFFEYKIGQGLRTNILFDLYNKLSLLMPQIALPVKLYERRKGYTGNSFETVLSGLSVRVDEDRSNNIEENFPTSGSMTVSGQKMKYSIYVFKKGKHEKFTKDEGIVFTINGQTHGSLSKSFFIRKNVGLSYLADSILVILDCTEIDGRSREDLFMNSRDRLSSCPLRTEIERDLEEVLKNHAGLRALKDKRRREEIESKLSDQQPLAEVLETLLKKSPTLSRLFVQGLKIQNPFNFSNANVDEVYNGKVFPTIFGLSKKYDEQHPKQAHLNSRFRVEFKTDACNDYFDRAKEPGEFKLFVNGKESIHADINLWNGYANLNVQLEGVNSGDLLHLKTVITDISRSVPFTEEFFVRVCAPMERQGGSGGGRKPPAGNQQGQQTKKADGFALPNIVEVTRDGRSGHSWAEQNFDENSALAVKDGGTDGYDFFVNLDNIHLLTEQKNLKGDDIQTVQAKYKFGLVLLGMAMLNGANESSEDRSELEVHEEPNVTYRISSVTKAISPVLIPMIDSLGALDISDLVVSSEESN